MTPVFSPTRSSSTILSSKSVSPPPSPSSSRAITDPSLSSKGLFSLPLISNKSSEILTCCTLPLPISACLSCSSDELTPLDSSSFLAFKRSINLSRATPSLLVKDPRRRIAATSPVIRIVFAFISNSLPSITPRFCCLLTSEEPTPSAARTLELPVLPAPGPVPRSLFLLLPIELLLVSEPVWDEAVEESSSANGATLDEERISTAKCSPSFTA